MSALNLLTAVVFGSFGLACAIFPLWLLVDYLLPGRSLGAALGRDWVFGIGFMLFFVVTGCSIFYIFAGSVFQRVRVSAGLLEIWGLWGQYRRWELTEVAKLSGNEITQPVDDAALFLKSLSETPDYDIGVWWSGSKYNEQRLQVFRRVGSGMVEQTEWFIRGAAKRSEVCAALLGELTRLHPGFRIRPDVYKYCGLPTEFSSPK